MTFASLLLRLLLCLALVAGTGVPLPSMAMASPAGAEATSERGMPCHGDAAGSDMDVPDDPAPDAPPGAVDTCCDGSCACQCIVPAVAMPGVAIATLQGPPPSRPQSALRAARASPPVEFPTRPPIATA